MPNVIDIIPNLIGGISQQSPALRLSNQCQDMVNWHATAADGLHRRPNSDFVAVLGQINTPTGIKSHTIERDESEKYIVMFTTDPTDPIKVFDLDGNAMTVRYGRLDADLNFTIDGSVRTYLTDGSVIDAQKQIKAISVADHTFVVNTKKTCQKSSSTSASQLEKTYLYVKSRHGGTYTIQLRWTSSGIVQTASWEVSSSASDTDTASLASLIASNASVDANANFSITAHDSIVTFTPSSGSVDLFSTTVNPSDPWGGQDLVAINNHTVNKLADLPARMPDDTLVRVGGDVETHQDDYYMQYSLENSRWYESLGPDLELTFDEDTMPHRLVRTAVGEFTFSPCIWEERIVGDDNSNGFPSFTNNVINNVTFHRNRLWFLSNDNAVGSKVGSYFNFFRSTVLELLDDDPVDLSVASEQVTTLKAAKPFEKGLILFGSNAQSALHAGDNLVLGPTTAGIDQTTKFSVDDTEPVKLGSSIYFVCPKESFMAVREYTVSPDTLLQTAVDVTMHVPRFIPNGTISMTGCNQLDMLFMHVDNSPGVLYVHQFLWEGNKKIQQAWYKWTFHWTIKGIEAIGTDLYLIINDPNVGYRLEKIRLENCPIFSEPFRYCLDGLVKLTGGSYDSQSDVTVFDLPFNCGLPDEDMYSLIDDTDKIAVSPSEYTPANNTLTIYGDQSAKSYWFGRNFTSTYRFSPWYYRGDNKAAVITGVLQTHQLTLAFLNAGNFRIEVTPRNGNTFTDALTDTMTGIRVDESIIGQVSLMSGEKNFTIAADSKNCTIDLISDSYTPVHIQMGTWMGVLTVNGMNQGGN